MPISQNRVSHLDDFKPEQCSIVKSIEAFFTHDRWQLVWWQLPIGGDFNASCFQNGFFNGYSIAISILDLNNLGCVCLGRKEKHCIKMCHVNVLDFIQFIPMFWTAFVTAVFMASGLVFCEARTADTGTCIGWPDGPTTVTTCSATKNKIILGWD